MSAHVAEPSTAPLSSQPEEAIIALDDINEHDIYALEAPVERSFDAVAEVFANDPVSRFFARPGQEREFVAALLRSVRQKACFSIYECCSFSAVALVRDTEEEGIDKLSTPAGPEIADAEALANLVEDEGTKALKLLGYSDYEANLLRKVKPEVIPAFEAFQEDTKKMLCEYARECGHGHHVLYLQFLATTDAVQRQGLASKLLHHLSATADAHGKHLYVEVSSKRHWNLFSDHGFRPWKDYKIGGKDANIEGAPEIVIMVRPPETKPEKGHGGAAAAAGVHYGRED